MNCGGHAFATDGFLLGPILEEFKQKKEQLIQSAHELFTKALHQKEIPVPEQPLPLQITAQGGVGTAEEHEFLLNHYQLNTVGWGSPFLLVPEATSVDIATRALLAKAQETDFYLSHISPLGIPFNTVKGTSNQFLKEKRILENKAGSSCPKKLLALSKEFDIKGTCTASKKYQDIKLEELVAKKATLSPAIYSKLQQKITEKSCLCVGLANASYLENGIEIKGQDQGVVICPGPNLAYFDKEISLSEMTQHIYGNTNVMTVANRPNLFVKELKMYVDYLKLEIDDMTETIAVAQIKKWNSFKNNLLEGIVYYETILTITPFFESTKNTIFAKLQDYKKELLSIEIPMLELV